MLTNFTGNLYGPVEVGHIFIISGKTVDGASVFDVNLASAKYEEADIPLHLSVHFHSESIVRNSLIDQEWGEEEVDENIMASPNPIVAGWDFKVLIMTTDDKFHIAVNDYPYCTYAYRLPIENIHTLLINGDMQKIFQVDHRRIFPSPWPILHEDIKRGPELSFDIPKQFYPGHVSVIHAIPSGNHNGNFIIKLMKGASKREMFHFSARFNQRAVIVNSHLSDSLELSFEEIILLSFNRIMVFCLFEFSDGARMKRNMDFHLLSINYLN